MVAGNIDGATVTRAQNAIKVYALSMYATLGHPSPGEDRLGQMASDALSFLSPSDLKHPESPNLAALGQLQQMVMSDIGANRPRNKYGAEAARAAQAAGGADGLRALGIGTLDTVRGGSSARYRELAGESSRRSGSDAAATSGYASAASLNFVTTTNFTRTPFAAAGMDYATFAYVRGQDRALTGQNLLHAVDDAKQLGFAATDKEAIRDHAVIDHYSRDPRHANQALQDYDRRKHGDAELEGWVKDAAQEKNPAKRAELNERIKERRAQYRQESGVQQHIEHDHPKAGAAVRNRANRMDMRDTEGATLGRMRKAGIDSVRDADFSDRRAKLSETAKVRTAKAEQAQAASSAAKQDMARKADHRSLLAMADDDVSPPTPEKAPSPSAEAAKPAPGKPAEPKKADTPSVAGKGEAKAGHPAKPATPARTRVAGAAGPSIG